MFSYFWLDKQMEGVLFKNGQKQEEEDEEGDGEPGKRSKISFQIGSWALAAVMSGGYFPGVSMLSPRF